jgi:release factor glutamine methyltransferase
LSEPVPQAAATVAGHVSAARARLRDAGLSVAEAELGARLLAQHVLGWSAERFLADGRSPAPDGFADRFDAWVARRAAREPLAYIVGEREFWGLALEVSPSVLIPRPETELIVEAALELHPDRHGPLTVADACTGSGCVAIALASERPSWNIAATDISEAALAVARRNAVRHGVGDRVRFVCTDLLRDAGGPFDVIVANPPYVRSVDREGLQPEVRVEPEVAIYAGPDGLATVARLVADAPARLRPGGYLIFEFGLGHDVEVETIVAASPHLSLLAMKRDLQGIARTVVARRG